MTSPEAWDAHTNEVRLRWEAHFREHGIVAADIERRFDEIAGNTEKALAAVQTALRVALADHEREHTVHEVSHQREHTQTELALTKADIASDKRFAGVNEFRAQLADQATRFATTDRLDALLGAAAARNDTLDREMNRRFEEHAAAIEVERNARIRSEGALASFRFLVALVGLPAIIGTLLGLASAFGPK